MPETLTCKQTLAITNHRILNGDLNEHGTLFGGRLMEILDATASVTAQRACRSHLVTAALDNVQFIAPFTLDDAMCIETYLTGSGTRSMEVFVKIIGEKMLTGERFLGATAFITFVATDDDVTIPAVKPESDEEIYLCQGYSKRKQQRQLNYQVQKDMKQYLSLKQPWL